MPVSSSHLVRVFIANRSCIHEILEHYPRETPAWTASVINLYDKDATRFYNEQTLLAGLRKRVPAWAEACRDNQVQVTANKQFAELYTVTEGHDEVAIVPTQK